MDIFADNQEIFNLFDDDTDPKIKTPVKNDKNEKKKKSSKSTYKAQMEAAIKTPFKCKNHTNEHLRVRAAMSNSVTCGSCGFKCEGKSGFLSCPKTPACFHLCSVCRVCPQNHVLRNCLSLKQHEAKNPLYGQDKFKCQGCNVEQKMTEEGVLHCVPCSYSICLGCITKLNEFWEKQQQNQ